MHKQKKGRDPMRVQKRVAAVIAIVLCLSRVHALVAGLLAY